MYFSSILFKLTLEQFLENQICNTGPNCSSALSTYIIVYDNTCMESKLKVDQFLLSSFSPFLYPAECKMAVRLKQHNQEQDYQRWRVLSTEETRRHYALENFISPGNMVPPIPRSVIVSLELKAVEYFFSLFFPHLFVLAITLDTIHPCADGKYKPHALKSHVSLLLEVGLVVAPQLCSNPRLPPSRLQLLLLPRLPRSNWKCWFFPGLRSCSSFACMVWNLFLNHGASQLFRQGWREKMLFCTC